MSRCQKKNQMCDALADSIIPPKKIKLNTASCSTANTSSAPDQNDFSLNFDTDQDIATLKTETFDLIDFNTSDNDDDLLMKYLDKNEQILTNQLVPQNDKTSTEINRSDTPLKKITNTYNQSNNFPTMPVIPKMFFPNSNVTINYNFNAK